MKAAVYSRKSRFTVKGESIENQVQLCRQYLCSIGVSDIVIYEDEGFSGKNDNRPMYKKMIMSGKFFKNNNTEISNVKVEFQKTNIADMLINNNTKANMPVREVKNVLG